MNDDFVFCTFCHKESENLKEKKECEYCQARDDWYLKSHEHIQKWKDKKLPYSLEQYIEISERLRKNGFSFSCTSFTKDASLSYKDIVDMAETNMELIVGGLINKEDQSDLINQIFRRQK